MRFIQGIFKRESLEKPVGRWFRDACEKRTARKIDLSNEDHCGPCGEYAIMKNKDIVEKQLKQVGLQIF